MKQISDIVRINNSRVKIYLDGESRFPLYKSDLKKYKLEIGKELSEELIAELSEKVAGKRATLRAMELLTQKSYTEAQLRRKLTDGYYEAEQTEQAIQYVKSFGYLDDARFAQDYIDYHKEKLSRLQMKNKLLAKGISKNLIEEKLNEIAENEGEDFADLEQQQIRKLFLKKYKGVLPEEPAEKNKVYQYFLRRGYSFSAVKKAIGDGEVYD